MNILSAMTSEQFSLTWNDFQETVSSSFKTLRNEKDFFDVTLVSDDEKQVPAHKLLLSACSSFFKSILKKSSNPHPIIFLSGIDSKNLNIIVDYIYEGEVKIYQDQLDMFLKVARKLKIEGLQSSGDPHLSNLKEEKLYPYPEEPKDLMDFSIEDGISQDEYVKDFDFSEDTSFTKGRNENTQRKLEIEFSGIAELDEKIQEMMTIDGGIVICTVCNKTTKSKNDMKRHIETHIEGLSFPCSKCAKSFRSRNALYSHSKRSHN